MSLHVSLSFIYRCVITMLLDTICVTFCVVYFACGGCLPLPVQAPTTEAIRIKAHQGSRCMLCSSAISAPFCMAAVRCKPLQWRQTHKDRLECVRERERKRKSTRELRSRQEESTNEERQSNARGVSAQNRLLQTLYKRCWSQKEVDITLRLDYCRIILCLLRLSTHRASLIDTYSLVYLFLSVSISLFLSF